MVHLFTPENRNKYRMESLWKDAKEIALFPPPA
jgi:ribosomal silencing factor RsfS